MTPRGHSLPEPSAPRQRSGAGLVLLLATTLLAGPACQDNETAIARGDRLWADTSYTAALAEYRLAVAQRGDEDARTRLAHAFAVTGQAEEAWQVYRELADDSDRAADQAVYDLLRLARRAEARNDIFGTVAALDAALALRPALQLPETALAVARFYRERDEPERALEYYTRALTTLPPEDTPRVLFEIGLVLEEEGECLRAIDYYRAFQQQARELGPRPWRTLIGEARWHTGSCAFRLAREATDGGRGAAALDWLDTMIEIGEPENLLDQALFERGELLFRFGRYDDALADYRRVLERNPARTGRLVVQAQERIDEIRFGRAPGADTAPATPPGF